MGIIKARDLKYEYFKYDDNGQTQESQTAVDSVNLDIREGQFISILGHNGSGKSTLAKHMNALLIPTEGTMWVDGKRYRCHGRTVGNPTDRGNGISEPG